LTEDVAAGVANPATISVYTRSGPIEHDTAMPKPKPHWQPAPFAMVAHANACVSAHENACVYTHVGDSHHQAGVISAQDWQALREGMIRTMRTELVQQIWRDMKHAYNEDFRAMVDAALEDYRRNEADQSSAADPGN
jgi:hypothetical protein